MATFCSIRKDFSNFSEVLKFIKNDQEMQSMADRTFDEIASNELYSYEYFIQNFDNVISNEFNGRGFVKCRDPYSDNGFQLAKLTSWRYFFGSPFPSHYKNFFEHIHSKMALSTLEFAA